MLEPCFRHQLLKLWIGVWSRWTHQKVIRCIDLHIQTAGFSIQTLFLGKFIVTIDKTPQREMSLCWDF